MPSSSSDDEDMSKFREAADSSLYSDALFKGKQAHNQDREITAIPPSLRNIEGEEEDKIHNELRVTPAFQKHVAKHLSKLLDSQLEINKNSGENNINSSDKARCILKAKRVKDFSDTATSSKGGVRLFGASAVFLSSMNIAPAAPHRRRKRCRILASFSSGSESSSEDSDSDNRHKLSAAAVSSDWVLSGTAVKGWTSKQSKVETGIFSKALSKDWAKKKSSVYGSITNAPYDPVTAKDELSRGYESLSEISCTNNNSKEVLNFRAKDDIAVLKLQKKKKGAIHLESELAASFSSVVSINSDSQGDTSHTSTKSKKKKKKKKKRMKIKEHYSEDATTETTEVEDVIDDRRKKVKKGRKKSKRLRLEEKESEKIEVMKLCVPGLLTDKDNEESRPKQKKKKLKNAKREISFLKERKHKLSKILKPISKRKLSTKVKHLSEDLAKLMMNSNDASSS